MRADLKETSPVTACHMKKTSLVRAGQVELVPSEVPETMEMNDSGIDLEGQYLYRALQCFMQGMQQKSYQCP